MSINYICELQNRRRPKKIISKIKRPDYYEIKFLGHNAVEYIFIATKNFDIGLLHFYQVANNNSSVGVYEYILYCINSGFKPYYDNYAFQLIASDDDLNKLYGMHEFREIIAESTDYIFTFALDARHMYVALTDEEGGIPYNNRQKYFNRGETSFKQLGENVGTSPGVITHIVKNDDKGYLVSRDRAFTNDINFSKCREIKKINECFEIPLPSSGNDSEK